MNTESPKTFSTAYNAKRAAGQFLIAQRMDPATPVTVIKLSDKAFTYSLPLDAAPVVDVAAAEDLEAAQFAAIRGAELVGEFENAAVEPVVLDAVIAATVDVETETRPADIAPDDEDDVPMIVPNPDEAAAVAELEAAAQAKAAKRKGRRPFDEVVAARLASTEQPAPTRANKGKPAAPRKQREPKAADAPAVPRVKRADGLTEGSAMAKLVDYAAEAPRTNAELCAHVGWAQCLPMLRKGAERTGRRFSVSKVQGEPTRYQLVAA